jgi:subtilase family serine protease
VAVANGDGAIGELLATNNARAVKLGVGPDLTVDTIAAPGAVAPGAAVSVEDVTRNRGIGPVGESVTTFYLSTTPTLGADAVEVGTRRVPPLAAGESHRGTATLSLPASAGAATAYYLLAKADGVDGITETNEANNLRAITVAIGPDLVIESLSAPAVALAGDVITVVETTRNRGVGPSAPTSTGFYLSTRTVLDPLAIRLGRRDVPGLTQGTSHTATLALLIPPGVGEAGVYYVLAVADDERGTNEREEANNVRAARVAIGPDLIIDAVTVPAAAAPGETLTLPDAVRNRGLAPSAPTRLQFYLSTRKSYDPFLSVPIGGRTVPELAGGVRDTSQTVVTIPLDAAPGAYYIVAVIDATGDAVETEEDNNGRYWPLLVR